MQYVVKKGEHFNVDWNQKNGYNEVNGGEIDGNIYQRPGTDGGNASDGISNRGANESISEKSGVSQKHRQSPKKYDKMGKLENMIISILLRIVHYLTKIC